MTPNPSVQYPKYQTKNATLLHLYINCSFSNFTHFFNYKHGNCYTFNSGLNGTYEVSSKTGPLYGKSLPRMWRHQRLGHWNAVRTRGKVLHHCLVILYNLFMAECKLYIQGLNFLKAERWSVIKRMKRIKEGVVGGEGSWRESGRGGRMEGERGEDDVGD